MEQTTNQTEVAMRGCVEKLGNEFNSIRTGRAHPSMLENVNVEVYGQTMKLNACSSVSVSDATTLTVMLWDAANLKAVDKALRIPPHEFNPRIEGNTLYITLPPINKERRAELVKIVGQKEEEAKISIRNLRRDANQKIKLKKKEENLSEDDEESANKKIQQLTDNYIAKVSKHSAEKRKEIESV